MRTGKYSFTKKHWCGWTVQIAIESNGARITGCSWHWHGNETWR